MRQQCGTVYTWNCAGELYAIECALCEERPLCTLDEFADHMEVWHSDWQTPDQIVQQLAPNTPNGAGAEDELMQEVLAEQTNGEDNELKQQLVQQLNALEATLTKTNHESKAINNQVAYANALENALPVPDGQRLTTSHVTQLIDLYRSEPRLWNQSHEEFHNTELCRESWRHITHAWSIHCGREFSVTDVRIRVSTLCQRFLKQRERLEADGEIDEAAKFVHYDQLSFLGQQQALVKRQQQLAIENRKLLEIYEHYPILWHNAHKRLRCEETLRRRNEAHSGLQLALRLSGINLSSLAIQRRLQSLRKRYRLEKIRYLHSVVEGKQSEFVSTFEHYAEMEFLNKHIDPFVCAVCGKIFENLVGHQVHVQSSCQVQIQVNELPQQQIDKPQDPMPDPEKQQVEVNDEEILKSGEEKTHQEDLLKETPDIVANVEPSLETDSSLETSAGLSRSRARLSLQQTMKLIKLFQDHACLWDPNHLDFHSRPQRRLAWLSISKQLNFQYAAPSVEPFTWQMLHRKITDYTKYYRKERQRLNQQSSKIEDDHGRWCFYDAFRFLDDVLPISCELHKSLHQRNSNLKIIAIYQSYTQLWCTDHPDYTKRKQRQRHLESLCTRLQEECNLQMTVERLKGRLIEFRCHYRQCKVARLTAAKRSEPWTPSYDYYDSLRFLELHVSPFICMRCPSSFNRRSDYLRHERNVHEIDHEKELDEVDAIGGQTPSMKRRRRVDGQSNSNNVANNLEHICHICGMKFSLRNSLLAHLRRHLGQRTHVCGDCPKKFFNSTALRVHQRSHTKELPYVCEHCARGFVNASKLNQHVKRHRNQRDFPCNRCEKAFYTAHERDRHIRAHLNIRDKVCPYCSRAFVVGSAYYAHLNLHRGEKRYSCSTCNRRFAQYAGLYKHRRRCIPNEIMEE
ncbi:uncharacterized protein [Drosophila tropicalis]|uniref:uncharacterized protein n=1 Tax=Drosophila tropicalis TaxID=46794 RepID=UPI0035AB757F